MDNKKLKREIQKLIRMSIKLDKKGGPEKDGSLFEKISGKIDGILELFDLPSTPFTQSFFYFDKEPFDNEIDDLIKLLQQKSEEVKKSPKLSDAEFLLEAARYKRDPMDILSQIKCSTNEYHIWIYNNFLLDTYSDKELKKEVEMCLSEFRIADDYDILKQIHTIDKFPISDWESIITGLEAKGLRYIRKYIENKSDDFCLQSIKFKLVRESGSIDDTPTLRSIASAINALTQENKNTWFKLIPSKNIWDSEYIQVGINKDPNNGSINYCLTLLFYDDDFEKYTTKSKDEVNEIVRKYFISKELPNLELWEDEYDEE